MAFGGVFVIVGLILAWSSISLLQDARRTEGTVVGIEWRGGEIRTSGKSRHRDEPAAYPVVEFATADGVRRTFHSSTGSNPPAYEQGERVEVLYRADSPQDAKIDGFLSLWLLPLIFGGIGLFVAAIGAVIAIVRGRLRAQPVR
ncbi:DUF3592 domain-containing protein [Streptomyces sp. NPDC102360]|uniref:DUF3592 domain-containing protein n=1 Tax=Streptomyces sp. NPDC102360 TaxID=3366160 RepID=UPI003829583B